MGKGKRLLRSVTWLAAATLVASATAACRKADPSTPAEKEARGRELVQRAAATLKAAPSLTFDTVERHERVRRNGEKRAFDLTRQVRLRRPDRLWFHATTSGDSAQDLDVFYDGAGLTLMGNAQKVYARVDAPNTIDAMLDRVSERYDMPMPMADFLYSDPGQSFNTGEFKGGWVKRTPIDNAPCHEVHYTGQEIEFTLWLADDERALPCKADIIYTGRPGKPVSQMTFRNWSLGGSLPDGDFVAKVPPAYERIPIVERIPKDEIKKDAAKAMAAAEQTK